MGQVVVTVNGRAFPLSCADGEEPRIRRLAQYVDGKVGEFVKMHGQIGEARLILLAALVIADELSDTSDIVQRERSRTHGPGVDSGGSDTSAAVVTGIRGIAQRIESIAARLESS
jgi:cell division protein ZapA